VASLMRPGRTATSDASGEELPASRTGSSPGFAAGRPGAGDGATRVTLSRSTLPSCHHEAYRSQMHFQVLGPLEVTREGERLPLGGPKQRLVLAHMLIRADEVVSADVLIDEIWGEDPPDAARPSLYSYVSHLRRALGADRLVHRVPGYVLHAAPDEIDAARFESLVAQGRRRIASDPASAARILREALALWRGEPLADLSTEVSLQGEIERLDAMHLGALEDRIEADLAVGRHSELVPELERMVARYPLRERLCGQLMLALYRGGRQSDALTVYHRLRRALDAELGLEPSPVIEEVQRRILNHDPALELRGEPLRGYRILEQIGSGPLGVVHRAVELQTEREVAVKVLGAGRANDAGFVRRFQADARRVARLDHPHIVPLFDWWREPDAAYLIMRLMRGGSLADRLRDGQPSSALALRWAEQMGSALTSAHHQGVVHGDIRPENVLLDAEDNVYLSDFAVGYDPALEAAGRRDLKNRYVAPERRLGAPLSPAADVYGFGVLLAELLSGVTIGDAAAELRAALEGATAATPAERPTNAADLGASVRQALLVRAPSTPGADGRVYTMRNPYKGLRAFEEADEADFFGREDLVRRLAERLDEGGEAPRFLAVVGPSGSGKSSVVSAGLIPAVRAGAVPGSEEWFVAVMSPGERPFEQLEQVLLSVAVGAPLALAELLEARGGLREAVERVLPPGAELLLVIDQFEELFTLVSDEAVQRRFLDVMARTIDDASSRTRLVITLRADFYDRPLRHERFGRQLAARTHAVPPLTAGDLERVIAQPAERSGLRLEQGLVARIVAEMSEQPGALPLLQYALTELWERREGRRLSLPAYDSSGGIAAAVGRRAEQLVSQLEATGRETARQLFLRLVELGEGTPDTARRVRRSELLELASDAHRIEAVIDMFSRYRLLLFDRDLETREATVELAHEALLHAWPGLQRWVDEARDDLRQQRRLATAAGQWREAGRDPSFLLSGSRLEQAEQWAESTSVVLVPAEREYVAASIAERVRLATEDERRRAHEAELERRAVTRLRAFVVTLALAALLAGGLSVFALSEGQRAAREARFATARELAAAAMANLEVDAERSILLALAAIDETR
jgi:DNA-binding SARP family transcriptional activator